MKCHLCEEKPCGKGRPCIEKDSKPLYEDPEEARIFKVAAEVEALYYCELCRLEEIMEFARRMNYRKIGLAFCIGLAEEARVVGEILSKEFEVESVCCKVGGLSKEDFDMPLRPWIGKVSCNPAEQARILDEEGCQLLVVLGLCVGHDSIFYRHAKAPVTTLVTKDRKLGHNPVAAIYCPYIKKNLRYEPEERKGGKPNGGK
ncbi:MAG: DUF1847 domain-containing protein [Thermovirga sp.]|nr:DUF1847 domain-containing protein [Thermovirga sp.]